MARPPSNPPNHRQRRPHSSDTDPDDSDFEPNSDVTEAVENQQIELDRCNSEIDFIDETTERERIIRQQAELFDIHKRDVSNNNLVPPERKNSNDSSDVVPATSSAAVEFSNLNDLVDLEDLIDYDYDESYPSSEGSKVSTRGGSNISPEGSVRRNVCNRVNVSTQGGNKKSPEGSIRTNNFHQNFNSSTQGGIKTSPEGSRRDNYEVDINTCSLGGSNNNSPEGNRNNTIHKNSNFDSNQGGINVGPEDYNKNMSLLNRTMNTQGGSNSSPDGNEKVLKQNVGPKCRIGRKLVGNVSVSTRGGTNGSPKGSNIVNRTQQEFISIENDCRRDQSLTGLYTINHQGSRKKSLKFGDKNRKTKKNELLKNNDEPLPAKNNNSLQSKSSQQNPLSRNVWGSGLKSNAVVQESPFFKDAKDRFKPKPPNKRRNTILVDDAIETEALNNTLISKTKYVDKSEKAYKEALKRSKEIDILVKDCKSDIDSLFDKKKKMIHSLARSDLASANNKKPSILKISGHTSMPNESRTTVLVNPLTSHTVSNDIFSSSAMNLNSPTGSSASKSSNDKELVDTETKLVHDSEEESYLHVPHCVLFFCVQAKIGPIFKGVGSSHSTVQEMTRYDRGCKSLFREGSYRKMIDCKCEKKYHVHISDDDDLVDQMSLIFQQNHKDIPPSGVTQRYLNFINKNELINFERGYKEWLGRNIRTPPIDSPNSSPKTTNETSIRTNLSLLESNQNSNASPTRSVDEGCTEFVVENDPDNQIKQHDSTQKGVVEDSSKKIMKKKTIKEIKGKGTTVRIPRKSTESEKKKSNLENTASSSSPSFSSVQQPDSEKKKPNLENTAPTLSPLSSSVQQPPNVRNKPPQSSGGRRNEYNERRDNARNNQRQDSGRNDRSGGRNRGRSNPNSNSKPNERYSPVHNQGRNSNRRSPVDDDRYYYDERNNRNYEKQNYNRDFCNPHNNRDRDYGQFDGRGRDCFYNNQGNYMDNSSMWRAPPGHFIPRGNNDYPYDHQFISNDPQYFERNSNFLARDNHSFGYPEYRQYDDNRNYRQQQPPYYRNNYNDNARQRHNPQFGNEIERNSPSPHHQVSCSVGHHVDEQSSNVSNKNTSKLYSESNLDSRDHNTTNVDNIRSNTTLSENLRNDTDNEISVISNSNSVSSELAHSKKSKKTPTKKNLTFMINGRSVEYVYASQFEIFSGIEHALVNGTFYVMTKENTKCDKDMNKYICLENINKQIKESTNRTDSNSNTTKRDIVASFNDHEVIVSKIVQPNQSTKKRKLGVSFTNQKSKKKKVSKPHPNNMKSINDMCSTSSDTAKVLFDVLVKKEFIDASWKTTLVQFYDIEDPEIALSFKYNRVCIKEECKKEYFSEYDLSDVYWIFTGCSKHLIVDTLTVMHNKCGIHDPFEVFTEEERARRVLQLEQRRKFEHIINAKKLSKK